MRRHALVCSLLFVGFLLAVLVQTVFRPIPMPELAGEATEPVPPALSARSWFRRQLQEQAESWLDQRVGFRAAWVRNENQVGFALFGEVRPTGITKILVGKDNWLYEKGYVRGLLEGLTMPHEDVRRAAEDLARFQDRLAQHGIAFLLIISPNKAAVYTE
jgi:hypothetical protein